MEKISQSAKILFEDAFDVASFLDKSEAPGTSSPRVPDAPKDQAILFEEAFDVASFLDKSEAPGTSSPSSSLAVCNSKNPEDKFQLYVQNVDFFKGFCCVNTQFKQGVPDAPKDQAVSLSRTGWPGSVP
ncbi:hypothetical protein E5288_WYG002882 [Bos mutus]|uniref:Uncharacterized protein n=1 Tax=Bos mutus TaxID=72004 RepID=A0A6B0RYB1_9CETA|nr:hypothetical protein [Bos mutus]